MAMQKLHLLCVKLFLVLSISCFLHDKPTDSSRPTSHDSNPENVNNEQKQKTQQITKSRSSPLNNKKTINRPL